MRACFVASALLVAVVGGACVGDFEEGERARFTSVTVVDGARTKRVQVSYQAVQDMAVYEGDILLGSVENAEQNNITVRGTIEDNNDPPPRDDNVAATVAKSVYIDEFPEGDRDTRGRSARWSNSTMPYVWDETVDPDDPELQGYVEQVQAAITHFNENTNLKIVPRTDHDHYITIQAPRSYVCYGFSHIGRTLAASASTAVPQWVVISTGCDWKPQTAIHEFGHAAGLYHEHTSPNRDDHVIIHWDNIDPAHLHQFEIDQLNARVFGPYDYHSVMHYRRNGFAINNLAHTISRVDGRAVHCQPSIPICWADLGPTGGLTQGDIDTINHMYPAVDLHSHLEITLLSSSATLYDHGLVMDEPSAVLNIKNVSGKTIQIDASMDSEAFAARLVAVSHPHHPVGVLQPNGWVQVELSHSQEGMRRGTFSITAENEDGRYAFPRTLSVEMVNVPAVIVASSSLIL